MKALVLSGGGSRGAFQLGVLKKLQQENPDLDYDIYTGISVGALNSTLLATGNLKHTLPELENIWLKDIKGSSSVRTHRLMKGIIFLASFLVLFTSLSFIAFILGWAKWIVLLFSFSTIIHFALLCSFPFLKFLKINRSVYNTKPLRKLIDKRLDIKKLHDSSKRLRIGAVSYNTGKYKSVNKHAPNITNWIMASSAFPIFFPLEEIGDELWVDGGVSETVPLMDAIELGATEIDVILTSPPYSIRKSDSLITTQILRTLDLMSKDVMASDIVHDSSLHEKGIKIRIIAPKEHIVGDPLSFNPKKIREMMKAEYIILKDPHD